MLLKIAIFWRTRLAGASKYRLITIIINYRLITTIARIKLATNALRA
jgi:hypothetical protein